jgi:hypothetical protein
MSKELVVDPVVRREEVKNEYREVALNPLIMDERPQCGLQ